MDDKGESARPRLNIRRVVRFFHSSCLKFKRFIITDDLLAVTEHSIGLSELEERQRLKRIQHLLAPKISALLSAKLPFEGLQ